MQGESSDCTSSPGFRHHPRPTPASGHAAGLGSDGSGQCRCGVRRGGVRRGGRQRRKDRPLEHFVNPHRC